MCENRNLCLIKNIKDENTYKIEENLDEYPCSNNSDHSVCEKIFWEKLSQKSNKFLDKNFDERFLKIKEYYTKDNTINKIFKEIVPIDREFSIPTCVHTKYFYNSGIEDDVEDSLF